MSSNRILLILKLGNLGINFLILRLNTIFTFFLFKPYSSLTKCLGYSYLVLKVLNLTYLILRILCRRELLSLAYLYILKLSYCSFLLVFVRYRSLSYPCLILRVRIISYLVLRILSLWPFTFIKW
jgi:hypothetical protein